MAKTRLLLTCTCTVILGKSYLIMVLHSFWLFTFERYNGILGSQPTNNKNIEIQLMRHFLQDMFALSYNFPDEFRTDFEELCKFGDKSVGSLRELCDDAIIQYLAIAKRSVLHKESLLYIK